MPFVFLIFFLHIFFIVFILRTISDSVIEQPYKVFKQSPKKLCNTSYLQAHHLNVGRLAPLLKDLDLVILLLLFVHFYFDILCHFLLLLFYFFILTTDLANLMLLSRTRW